MVEMLRALITDSHPEKGWGLAEIPGGTIVFLHATKEVQLVLRGARLDAQPVPLKEAWIPPVGKWIVFDNFRPPENGGKYAQAVGWMPREYREKMERAAEKARATLAEQAEEIRRREAKRREAIEASQKRKGGTGRKNKEKQRRAG